VRRHAESKKKLFFRNEIPNDDFWIEREREMKGLDVLIYPQRKK